MSLSEADNTEETSSTSFGDSDESQDVRGILQSYFLENFGGAQNVPPRIPEMLAERDVRRVSRDVSVSTVSTALLLEQSSGSADNDYVTANEVEPTVEQGVRFLRREPAGNAQVSYVRTSFDGGAEAREYRLPRKVSQPLLEPEVAGRPKAPHSPSLLNNILMPSPLDQSARTIPALRAVSGSYQVQQRTWEARRQSVASVVKPQGTVLAAPERARIARLTDSQMDLTLSTLQEYQKDVEATAGRGTYTQSSGISVQHIDSSSIQSFDSQDHKFSDIYSIARITALIGICLIVPPLFFMIASGERGGGVSNYRLMRLIMNSKHRVGMMKGFVWDVDVGWFRYLCLSLGIFETLGILASIGSGIAIGRRRET
ncbi:hypothetical protein HG536_0E01030 [Torulaspora globosa]|uniref:Uncharacterized protein n=1 Tax=Torulaspora globosa TaxID=48254 RepID=A0A7G3ZI56_9SACH|nr:uncharacterized protein HG536_0E01030 [Torulaspora globosa]QLL33192.1 hypothetical protein HG536_0E01030 [Torulaspora globosa]